MRKHVIEPVMAGTEGVSKNIVAIYKNWVPGIDSELRTIRVAGVHYLYNNSKRFIEATALSI